MDIGLLNLAWMPLFIYVDRNLASRHWYHRHNSLELRRRGTYTGLDFSPRTPAPSFANRAASPVASSETLARQLVQVQDIGNTLFSGHRLQFTRMICPHPRHRHFRHNIVNLVGPQLVPSDMIKAEE